MAKPVNGTPPLPYPSGSRDIYALGAFDQDLTKALHAYLSELAFRINGSLPKDGTEPMTGDLDLGGNDIVNVGTISPAPPVPDPLIVDNLEVNINALIEDLDVTTDADIGGDLTVAGTATFSSDSFWSATAGTTRLLGFLTGTSNRWQIAKDNTAETGANAGSDFAIYSYDDAGAFLDMPFYIERSSGDIYVANQLYVGGVPVTTTLPVASTTQQGIVELATNAETGGQAGGTDTARAVTPDDLTFHSGRKETRILAINAVTTNVLDIGTNWAFIEMDWSLELSTAGTAGFQVSYDNGSSWQTTAASHSNWLLFHGSNAVTVPASGGTTSNYFGFNYSSSVSGSGTNFYGTRGHGILTRNTAVSGGAYAAFDYTGTYVESTTPAFINYKANSYLSIGTNIPNALRITSPSGATLTGWVKLEIYYA